MICGDARAVVPAADEGIALPLSQPDLADACGLTPGHTSRTLRELRQLDLLTLEDRFPRNTDVDRMRTMATIADVA